MNLEFGTVSKCYRHFLKVYTPNKCYIKFKAHFLLLGIVLHPFPAKTVKKTGSGKFLAQILEKNLIIFKVQIQANFKITN